MQTHAPFRLVQALASGIDCKEMPIFQDLKSTKPKFNFSTTIKENSIRSNISERVNNKHTLISVFGVKLSQLSVIGIRKATVSEESQKL